VRTRYTVFTRQALYKRTGNYDRRQTELSVTNWIFPKRPFASSLIPPLKKSWLTLALSYRAEETVRLIVDPCREEERVSRTSEAPIPKA
jgi:hypothetical protein